MKTTAIFKFTSTLDVYSPRLDDTSVVGSTVVVYDYKENVNALVVQSATGLTVTTLEPIGPFSKVSHIKDRNGQPLTIYPFMYVTEVKPELDFTGAVMAWKHTVKADVPVNFLSKIEAYNLNVGDPTIDEFKGHA